MDTQSKVLSKKEIYTKDDVKDCEDSEFILNDKEMHSIIPMNSMYDECISMYKVVIESMKDSFTEEELNEALEGLKEIEMCRKGDKFNGSCN